MTTVKTIEAGPGWTMVLAGQPGNHTLSERPFTKWAVVEDGLLPVDDRSGQHYRAAAVRFRSCPWYLLPPNLTLLPVDDLTADRLRDRYDDYLRSISAIRDLRGTDFAAPSPTFAEALAFARYHSDSIAQGPRALHWSRLAWDLRRRYPEIAAKALLRMGLAEYRPAITNEQFEAYWSDADRKEPRSIDECLVTRMRPWGRHVASLERQHAERRARQYPPPPPLIR